MNSQSLSTLVLGVVALAALAFAFLGDQGGDVPISERETIIVDGMGEVSVPHDYAAFNFSVETSADNPLDALQNNNVLMQGVLDSLLNLGIAQDTIETSRVSVHTVSTWIDPNNRSLGRVISYSADNTMRIRFTDLTGVGEAMSAVVAAGATDINGPTLYIDDHETPLAEARDLAVLDAIAMAHRIAETANLEVGRIIKIDDPAPDTFEQDDRYVSRRWDEEETFVITGSRIADVPLNFGEEDVNSFVRVTFELLPN